MSHAMEIEHSPLASISWDSFGLLDAERAAAAPPSAPMTADPATPMPLRRICEIRNATLAASPFDPAAYIATCLPRGSRLLSDLARRFPAYDNFVADMRRAVQLEVNQDLFSWTNVLIERYPVQLGCIYLDSDAGKPRVYIHAIVQDGHTYGVILALEPNNTVDALRALLCQAGTSSFFITPAEFNAVDDPADTDKALLCIHSTACQLKWVAFCTADFV